MLSQKVQDICRKYGYKHCGNCPLFEVCEVNHHQLPGATENEKTELWERLMNMTAEAMQQEASGE